MSIDLTNLATTRPQDLPEIGAAHLLARDIFCAVRLAYFKEDRWPAADARWVTLTREEKQAYIDAARAILETYRPEPLRHPPARDIVTGLGGRIIGGIWPKGAA